MSESYSVKAILSATDSGFSSTLKNALNTTTTLADKIKSGFAFGVLTGVGQRAFDTLTNSASELIGEVNSSSKAWQTFEGNMKNFGKNKKQINSVKKELQSFAETTVYSSSDMASTYAQLEAVGVGSMKSLSKGTSGLVKGFGGLAAAAEDPQQAMKSLSQQATQMAAKPKVAWEDFKIMLEQSPAGMAAVAKQMGMSTSDLISKIQAGKVSTESFFAAVEKAGNSKGFQEMATKAKTVDQAVDGLKETVGNKLLPTFEIFSKKGISAVDAITNKLGGIDGQALADKIGAGLDKAGQYFDAFVSAFDGVGTELMQAFKAVKDSVSGVTGSLKIDGSVENFKTTMQGVADSIKTVANFVEKHADTIGKVLPWIVKLAVAYKGFKVVSSVVPGLSLFTGAIKSLAGKGISGLAGKLFGVSKSQEAVGESSQASGAQVLASAKSYALMGIAVLAISAGFALLAYSAIQLANSGGAAIAVMAGMVVAVGALMVGMTSMLKSVSTSPKKLTSMATAMVALGVAVVLVATGFAILTYSAIQLANAGNTAIAVGVGMVVAVAALAAVFAALAPALSAGSAGLIAFGAAMVLVGAGAVLAAAALSIVSSVLPAIVAYGTQAATGILALGAALLVFTAGAIAAGAASIVLGAGFTVAAAGTGALGAATIVLGAGLIALATSVYIAAASLALLASQLPIISSYGLQGAAALAALGAGLLALGTGAATTAASFIALAAGLVATAGSAGAATVTLLTFTAGMAAGAAATVLMVAALKGVKSSMKAIASSAKSAESSLKQMRSSIDVVESGLDGLGSKAKSAMQSLTSAFDNTANKAKTAGQKTGTGFANGMQNGLRSATNKTKTTTNQIVKTFNGTVSKSKTAGAKVGTGFSQGVKNGLKGATTSAKTATSSVNTALRSGRSGAYSAGAYISLGFAQGMRSQLSAIRSAAAQMAAAADAAVRAKAKIHSPSKVSEKLGFYWGEGYVNGLSDMVKAAWKTASELVSVPNLAMPDLAVAYGGEMSADYDYCRNSEYTIEVPLTVDGKEFARATATYNQAELDRRETRNNRKYGRV